ncbi:hypothetical protein G9H72_14230 [Motilibacter sp. K478]|nr:hypothetical protein [Motilibacter aurantiacus]
MVDTQAELEVEDQRGDGRSVRIDEVRTSRGNGHVAVFSGTTLLGSAQVLLRNAGRVLTREHLLNRVWGLDHEPGTNVVDVYVS